MVTPLNTNLPAITGVDPLAQAIEGHLPSGFGGSGMSAANEALGVNLAVTHHNHSITLQSALLTVQNDQMKRLLANF